MWELFRSHELFYKRSFYWSNADFLLTSLCISSRSRFKSQRQTGGAKLLLVFMGVRRFSRDHGGIGGKAGRTIILFLDLSRHLASPSRPGSGPAARRTLIGREHRCVRRCARHDARRSLRYFLPRMKLSRAGRRRFVCSTETSEICGIRSPPLPPPLPLLSAACGNVSDRTF